jgi:ATP-dependent Clp protease, protease subunit
MELPEIVYAVFCGLVNELTAQKLTFALGKTMESKVKHVHLMFQSSGGLVGDGVFLYNYLRAIPIEITLYNCGQISSAGITVFLGAKHRVTNKTASFMIHSAANSAKEATSSSLEHIAKSLALDDERTDVIFRKHVNFTPEIWASMKYHDIFLSVEEAVVAGLADEIGEFAPPSGTTVYSILG